jgi:hypothetical protein
MAEINFGQFFSKIAEVAHIFGLLLSIAKIGKNGLGDFCKKTHLVITNKIVNGKQKLGII